jgi:hypothetical protein
MRGRHRQIVVPPLVRETRSHDVLNALGPDRDALVAAFGGYAARSLAVALESRKRLIELLDGEVAPESDVEHALLDAVGGGETVSMLLIGQEGFDGAGLSPRIGHEDSAWHVIVGDHREVFSTAREGFDWWRDLIGA